MERLSSWDRQKSVPMLNSNVDLSMCFTWWRLACPYAAPSVWAWSIGITENTGLVPPRSSQSHAPDLASVPCATALGSGAEKLS